MTSLPTPPRYVPERPLPPYAFVAGLTSHPRTDPSGHSYGEPEPEAAPLSDENWSTHEVYLMGLDLFNHGYYWESHEQWEALWHAAGREGRDASMLKALIKLAAASLKRRQARSRGVQSHCDNALVLLQSALERCDEGRWYGLSVPALIEMALGIKALAEAVIPEEVLQKEAPVIRVHDFVMRLVEPAPYAASPRRASS